MEKLLETQSELYGKIARAVENLQKTAASKITLSTVEARLQVLEKN